MNKYLPCDIKYISSIKWRQLYKDIGWLLCIRSSYDYDDKYITWLQLHKIYHMVTMEYNISSDNN